MSNAYFKVPNPVNEPVLSYAPGSLEKESLKKKLKELQSKEIEIPLIIGGKEVKTGKTAEIRAPHDHSKKLGIYHKAGAKEVEMAIKAALEARKTWSEMPWEHRASIFLKAADLLAGSWRSTLNAATMLGQSKTAYQAGNRRSLRANRFLAFQCLLYDSAYVRTALLSERNVEPRGVSSS